MNPFSVRCETWALAPVRAFLDPERDDEALLFRDLEKLLGRGDVQLKGFWYYQIALRLYTHFNHSVRYQTAAILVYYYWIAS